MAGFNPPGWIPGNFHPHPGMQFEQQGSTGDTVPNFLQQGQLSQAEPPTAGYESDQSVVSPMTQHHANPPLAHGAPPHQPVLPLAMLQGMGRTGSNETQHSPLRAPPPAWPPPRQ